jgi:hypothetical protein
MGDRKTKKNPASSALLYKPHINPFRIEFGP